MPPDPAVLDCRATRRLLLSHVECNRMKGGKIEATVTITDAQTDEARAFRNSDAPLTVNHLMDSSALLVLFSPAVIDGRPFFDTGMTENIPRCPPLDPCDNALILACDLDSPTGTLQR
ncbi:hypothetical protein [Paracoccus sp. NSM]|uniref:hypothetical protein n=1 Tax=Paracoccus sp. NSM TaxID=3457784 RepID=UPI004035FB0F